MWGLNYRSYLIFDQKCFFVTQIETENTLCIFSREEALGYLWGFKQEKPSNGGLGSSKMIFQDSHFIDEVKSYLKHMNNFLIKRGFKVAKVEKYFFSFWR